MPIVASLQLRVNRRESVEPDLEPEAEPGREAEAEPGELDLSLEPVPTLDVLTPCGAAAACLARHGVGVLPRICCSRVLGPFCCCGVVGRWLAFCCCGVGVRLPELSQGGPPLRSFSKELSAESCFNCCFQNASFGLGGGGAGATATTGTSIMGRGVEDHGEGRRARPTWTITGFSSAAALEATARSCDMVLGAREALRCADIRSAL